MTEHQPSEHDDSASPAAAPRPESAWPPGPAAPEPGPPAPAPRPRRRSATLAALALLGGVAGGAVGASGLPSRTTGEAVAATVPRSAGAASPGGGTPQEAAAAISPSVVTIAVQSPSGSGTGSGVVLSAEGHIVTNAHVVQGAGAGSTLEVQLSDGTALPATVVGTDPTSDLAVLDVASTSLVPATFADSDALRVGQSVLAVGAPLGLSSTVTQGIVSTLHRPVRTGATAGSQAVIDAVQTDAAINPGNSGGALVDLRGQVVGIPSAIATTSSSSGSIGVGFAIPSNDAAEIADEIIADGRATHAQMGVSVGNGTDTDGAALAAVSPGGAAAAAGLRAGDVVVAVGDRGTPDDDTLIVAVRAHDPGDEVAVRYRRGGSEQTVTVILGRAA